MSLIPHNSLEYRIKNADKMNALLSSANGYRVFAEATDQHIQEVADMYLGHFLNDLENLLDHQGIKLIEHVNSEVSWDDYADWIFRWAGLL